MPRSPEQRAADLDPDLIDLAVVVRGHQAMYGALLGLIQSPFDDVALGRVLRLRQQLAADLSRAKLRLAARR